MERAVRTGTKLLKFVLGCFLTQKMCNRAMCEHPSSFFILPDHFKRQGLCNEGVMVVPSDLRNVSNSFKTQETCDDVLFGD